MPRFLSSLLSVCLALPLLLGCVHNAPAASPAAESRPRTCRLTQQADLHLRTARSYLLAPVSLNGHDVLMLVDTGAEATVLFPAAVNSLHLPLDAGQSDVLVGVGGSVRTSRVKVKRLTVGSIVRDNNSLPVRDLGVAFAGLDRPVAGLLGADLLAGYEVHIDAPGRRMALYSTGRGCAGYVPWPGARSVRLTRTSTGLVFVGAVVDGRPVQALLDTGARTTVLTREAAARLGVDGTVLGRAPTRTGVGVGARSVVFRQHRFAELGVPGHVARDVPVNIADLGLPGVDMLLGVDFLSPRQSWISYGSGRLFLR